ncbi:MAG: winged helix-turn-helix domain-containing protein [Nanoarchaeota archaeon]|nr:winged helix-turn-helix domain-containing protein [Nanoarchaeota archaeon]
MSSDTLVRRVENLVIDVQNRKSRAVRSRLVSLKTLPDISLDPSEIEGLFYNKVKDYAQGIEAYYKSEEFNEARLECIELMGYAEGFKKVQDGSLDELVKDTFGSHAQSAENDINEGRGYQARLHARYIMGAAKGSELALSDRYPTLRRTDGNRFTIGNRVVDLTPMEGELFTYFLANANKVIPIEKIIMDVRGREIGYSSMTTMINNLRRKLQPDPNGPQYIHHYRNLGYVFGTVAYSPPKIEYDASRRKLTINGQNTSLGKSVAQLFKYFYDHRGQKISRETIIQEVWGNEDTDQDLFRKFNNTLFNLNKKLTESSGYRLIVNFMGEGYMLRG